jgi:hypothetical protein
MPFPTDVDVSVGRLSDAVEATAYRTRRGDPARCSDRVIARHA